MLSGEKAARTFRMSAEDKRLLDALGEYLRTSQSDICSAALSLYVDRSEDGVEEEGSDSDVFGACRSMVQDLLRCSYLEGSTLSHIRLIHGGNTIDIPPHTPLKCLPPYTVCFPISSHIRVFLDLSLNMSVCCESTDGKNILPEDLSEWSDKIRLTIRLKEACPVRDKLHNTNINGRSYTKIDKYYN